MKFGTDTIKNVEITKMLVLKSENSGNRPHPLPPPLKIKSHRVELKIGTGIEIMMDKLKIITLKYENNENNHTYYPIPSKSKVGDLLKLGCKTVKYKNVPHFVVLVVQILHVPQSVVQVW